MVTIELPDGSPGEGEVVDFDIVDEEWNKYELEDGTDLYIKTVVTKVVRAENAITEQGEPYYEIRSQNIVRTDVPEELMPDPEELQNSGNSERGVQ